MLDLKWNPDRRILFERICECCVVFEFSFEFGFELSSDETRHVLEYVDVLVHIGVMRNLYLIVSRCRIDGWMDGWIDCASLCIRDGAFTPS